MLNENHGKMFDRLAGAIRRNITVLNFMPNELRNSLALPTFDTWVPLLDILCTKFKFTTFIRRFKPSSIKTVSVEWWNEGMEQRNGGMAEHTSRS